MAFTLILVIDLYKLYNEPTHLYIIRRKSKPALLKLISRSHMFLFLFAEANGELYGI